MDEAYAEDSFVVGSDVEELDSDEEEAEDVELLPEATFVDGRKQYATRRCVFLHKARAGASTKHRAGSPLEQRATTKTKRSRVIRVNDSSDDETEEASEEAGLVTGRTDVPLQPITVQPEPSGQKSTPIASSTLASKVLLLKKTQKSSVSEEQQKER